jgi:hypothetical protein
MAFSTFRKHFETISIGRSAHVSSEVFRASIETVFITYVENQRSLSGSLEAIGRLLYDKIGADHMIKIISFSPRTSGIFQMPDLAIFGLMKRQRRQIRPNEKIHARVDQTRRVYESSRNVTTATTVCAAFIAARFQYTEQEDEKVISIDTEKIRNQKGFRDV